MFPLLLLLFLKKGLPFVNFFNLIFKLGFNSLSIGSLFLNISFAFRFSSTVSFFKTPQLDNNVKKKIYIKNLLTEICT